MFAEIVLKSGTDKVTVRDISQLFADAIHPPVADDRSRQLTKIKKMPLTRDTADHWCGQGVEPFPVSLTAADLADLGNGVWRNLPPLSLPITEADWEPYRAAFEAAPPKDWRLMPELQSSFIRQMYCHHVTYKRYQELVREAARNGELTPRSQMDLAPAPNADGEYLLDCFVTIADLTDFAKKFDIGVRVAEQAPDCQATIERMKSLPALEAKRWETADRRANGRRLVTREHAGLSGACLMTLEQFCDEVEERLTRWRNGRYLLVEAAQVLADANPGLIAESLCKQMERAIHDGKLKLCHNGIPLPVAAITSHRLFIETVLQGDVNRWLIESSADYALAYPYLSLDVKTAVRFAPENVAAEHREFVAWLESDIQRSPEEQAQYEAAWKKLERVEELDRQIHSADAIPVANWGQQEKKEQRITALKAEKAALWVDVFSDDSLPKPAPAPEVKETPAIRRARWLVLFEIEEKREKRGALQRVADSERVDRSNMKKDIDRARAARHEQKQAGGWTSQLVQDGKRKD